MGWISWLGDKIGDGVEAVADGVGQAGDWVLDDVLGWEEGGNAWESGWNTVGDVGDGVVDFVGSTPEAAWEGVAGLANGDGMSGFVKPFAQTSTGQDITVQNPDGTYSFDFDGNGVADSQDKVNDVQAAFAPTEEELAYTGMLNDKYEWWKDNYLPMYEELRDRYRGVDNQELLNQANVKTDQAFSGMEGQAERTAQGFGINADIDSTKWNAMKAATKAGNAQEFKLDYAIPDELKSGQ